MSPTATRERTAIISVSHPHTLAANNITSACGTTYKYIRSMDKPHFAILVECLCPQGHGATTLPRRYWLTRKDADLDCNFADLTPQPSTITSTIDIPSPEDINIIPIDVLETLTLDQVAAVANTYRQAAAPAAA